MSHTCDKLFNSVDSNKSKSKQLANSVRGLFVAIYRCAQAVPALQSPIKGKPFNDSLGMTSITQHIWQPRIWQPILLHTASEWPGPSPQQLFACFPSGLAVVSRPSAAESGSTACARATSAITFLHHTGFRELLKSPQFHGSGWVISPQRKDKEILRQWRVTMVPLGKCVSFFTGKVKIIHLMGCWENYLNVNKMLWKWKGLSL